MYSGASADVPLLSVLGSISTRSHVPSRHCCWPRRGSRSNDAVLSYLFLQSALALHQMANETYLAYKQHTRRVSEPPGAFGLPGQAELCWRLSSLYWPAKAPGPHSRGATDEGSQRKNAWGLASGRKTGARTNEYDRQGLNGSQFI